MGGCAEFDAKEEAEHTRQGMNGFGTPRGRAGLALNQPARLEIPTGLSRDWFNFRVFNSATHILHVVFSGEQAAEIIGQYGRAKRDYCRAQHVHPSSTTPALLRARLDARLGRLEAEVHRCLCSRGGNFFLVPKQTTEYALATVLFF